MALFGAAEDVLVEAERDQREILGDPCGRRMRSPSARAGPLERPGSVAALDEVDAGPGRVRSRAHGWLTSQLVAPSAERQREGCDKGLQFGLAVGAGLVEEVQEVGAHRAEPDAERLRGLGVGPARGDLPSTRASVGVRSKRAAIAAVGAGRGPTAGARKMAATALGRIAADLDAGLKGMTCSTSSVPSRPRAGTPSPCRPMPPASRAARSTATASAAPAPPEAATARPAGAAGPLQPAPPRRRGWRG